MAGKGSARQGSDYQSGGIAKSSWSGMARRGMARWGRARQGHFGAMVAVTANRQGLAGPGSAGQGQARHGKVFFQT